MTTATKASEITRAAGRGWAAMPRRELSLYSARHEATIVDAFRAADVFAADQRFRRYLLDHAALWSQFYRQPWPNLRAARHGYDRALGAERELMSDLFREAIAVSRGESETSDVRARRGRVVVSASALSRQYRPPMFSRRRRRITHALKEATVDFYAGELVGIVGQNGSGKSTLLRLLACQERPTSGRLMILGEDAGTLRGRRLDDLRGEAIEYIPQKHLGLTEQPAVAHVAFWLRRYDGLSDDQARVAGESALAATGLEQALWSKVVLRETSGGEGTKIAIAKALARNRPVCIADEALAELDPERRVEVVQLFRAMARRGAAVVLVLHNREMEEYFDRILALSDGYLVHDRSIASPRY